MSLALAAASVILVLHFSTAQALTSINPGDFLLLKATHDDGVPVHGGPYNSFIGLRLPITKPVKALQVSGKYVQVGGAPHFDQPVGWVIGERYVDSITTPPAAASASPVAEIAAGQFVKLKATHPKGVPLHERAASSFSGNRVPDETVVRVLAVSDNYASVSFPPAHSDAAPDGWIHVKYIESVVRQGGGGPPPAGGGGWVDPIPAHRHAAECPPGKKCDLPICPSGRECTADEINIKACNAEEYIEYIITTDDIRGPRWLRDYCPEKDDSTEHVIELNIMKHFTLFSTENSLHCDTIRYLNTAPNFNCWPSAENVKKAKIVEAIVSTKTKRCPIDTFDRFVIELISSRFRQVIALTNDDPFNVRVNYDLKKMFNYWLSQVANIGGCV